MNKSTSSDRQRSPVNWKLLTVLAVLLFFSGAISGAIAWRYWNREDRTSSLPSQSKITDDFEEAFAFLKADIETNLTESEARMEERIARLKPEVRIESKQVWDSVKGLSDAQFDAWFTSPNKDYPWKGPVTDWVFLRNRLVHMKSDFYLAVAKWGWDRVIPNGEKSTDHLSLWLSNLSVGGIAAIDTPLVLGTDAERKRSDEFHIKKFKQHFPSALAGKEQPTDNDRKVFRKIFGDSATAPKGW